MDLQKDWKKWEHNIQSKSALVTVDRDLMVTVALRVDATHKYPPGAKIDPMNCPHRIIFKMPLKEIPIVPTGCFAPEMHVVFQEPSPATLWRRAFRIIRSEYKWMHNALKARFQAGEIMLLFQLKDAREATKLAQKLMDSKTKIKKLETRIQELEDPPKLTDPPKCKRCSGHRTIWDVPNGGTKKIGCPVCNPDDRYGVLKKLTDEDRKEIYEFAMDRSDTIIKGKD